MRCKLSGFLAVVLVCLLAKVGDAGLITPFVDTGFTNISPDDDVDLIVVRESFDSNAFTQSVYFRMRDVGTDLDEAGGTIRFSSGVTGQTPQTVPVSMLETRSIYPCRSTLG